MLLTDGERKQNCYTNDSKSTLTDNEMTKVLDLFQTFRHCFTLTHLQCWFKIKHKEHTYSEVYNKATADTKKPGQHYLHMNEPCTGQITKNCPHKA
jgi:hypothetical protein